jgi:hypothetical protein
MLRLIVVDYDGCLVIKNCKSLGAIHPDIASAVRRIMCHAALIIVSARASEAAVISARSALTYAGLADIPFFSRDWTVYDNSADGILAAKTRAIRDYSTEFRAIPWIGIGDNDLDQLVYQECGMGVIRFLWNAHPKQINAFSPTYAVTAERLAGTWQLVCEYIDRLMNETLTYGTD